MPAPPTDWQFAALIVLLVVVPGAVEQFEALHGRVPAGGTALVGAAPSPATRAGRSRHVCPPRSC